MEQSATIAELAKALSKAQGEIKGAIKDSNNPFFNKTYADLSSVWEACRKPLSSNGLAVIQTCCSEGLDVVVIETTLAHGSGEWVRGKLAMKPVKIDPQGVGSCITYARRYALAAIVGVAPEDDDGNEATKGDQKKTKSEEPKKSDLKEPPPEPKTSCITDAQRKRLFAIVGDSGIKESELKLYLKNIFGIESSKDILKTNYDEICKWAGERKPGEEG